MDLLISSQDWSKDHSQLALVLGGRVSRLPSDISVGYRHAQLLILPSVDHRAPKSAICSILCLCFDLGHMPFVGSSRPSFCTSPSCTENLSVGFLFLWLPDGFGQGDTPFQEIRGKRVSQTMHRSGSHPAVTSGWLCLLTRGHCFFPDGQPCLTSSYWVLVIAHSFQPMAGNRAAFIALGYCGLL